MPEDQSAGAGLQRGTCAYALAGQKDKAIAKLGQALRLQPDLTEWSQQDPDFASIREDAAYLALYTTPSHA